MHEEGLNRSRDLKKRKKSEEEDLGCWLGDGGGSLGCVIALAAQQLSVHVCSLSSPLGHIIVTGPLT